MSVESREDATRLAQQIVERGASIVTIIEELLAQDTHGLACNKTVQLKDLSAENTAAAQILACWLLNQPRPLPPPPPLIRPQISLLLVHPDNHPDSLPTLIKIVGNRVTPAMLEAAKDLLHTLTTGERTLPSDLYEVIARAFGVTLSAAKGRILLAIYGGKGAPVTPSLGEPSV